MWQSKRLGDIATFINGYPFKPSDWNDEGLEIIRIQNLTKSSKECNYYKGEINSKYKIKDGDILISWSATLGVFEWKGNDAWLNQHIFKVQFNKEPIDKKFFTFLIEHVLDDLKSQVHGATMQHITKSNFDNTLVPIPSIETQKAIAEKLDKADALRKKDKELLKQYDELAQSIFIDMFGDPVQNEKGWELNLLGNISYFENGDRSSNYPSGDDLIEIGVPFLSTSNFSNDCLNLENVKFISEVKFNSLRNGKTEYGDLIITLRGTLGQVVIYDSLVYKSAFINAQMMIIRGKEISNKILYYFFKNDRIVELIKNQRTGCAVPQITSDFLRNLKIPLYPKSLQNQFAEKIKNIEAQKALVKQQAQQSEDLFQALLQQSFTF